MMWFEEWEMSLPHAIPRTLDILSPFAGVCWAFEMPSQRQALAKHEADKAGPSVSLQCPNTQSFCHHQKKRLWKTHPNVSMSNWVAWAFQEYLLFTSEPQKMGIWGNVFCGDWSSEQKVSYWIKQNLWIREPPQKFPAGLRGKLSRWKGEKI